MIEYLASPDHVVAMRARGRITGDDLDHCIAVIEDALARHARIGIYGDMRDFEGMTAEALFKDLRYGASKLGQLDRFARIALVADEGWLRSLALMEARMLPQVEMAVFDGGQAEQASAWAAQLPAGSTASS